MSRTQTADPSERLPWLSDPVRPQPRQPKRSWLPLLLAASTAGAIAFGGWKMVETASEQQPVPSAVQNSRTVRVPPPMPSPVAEAQPQAPSAGERDALRPQAAQSADAPASDRARRPVRSAERSTASRGESARSSRERTERADSRPAAAPAVRRAPRRAASVAVLPQPRTLWPSRQVSGAYGRLVQIGAFGSRQQAKLGWRRMQRAYPAVGRLPAVVVEARNSKGRKFYRFQIGTTSQAHSEVLCQRMRPIGLSCAVLGLPWKAKVER